MIKFLPQNIIASLQDYFWQQAGAEHRYTKTLWFRPSGIPEFRKDGIPFGRPKFQNKSDLFMLKESI